MGLTVPLSHACFDNNSEGWSKWDHYVDGARKVLG